MTPIEIAQNPMVMGIIVSLFVEVTKRVPIVPIEPGQTAALRILTAVLSLSLAIVSGYVGGPEKWAAQPWDALSHDLIDAVVTYFVATGVFTNAKKNPLP